MFCLFRLAFCVNVISIVFNTVDLYNKLNAQDIEAIIPLVIVSANVFACYMVGRELLIRFIGKYGVGGNKDADE